jgi:hypothetical protein
MASPLQVLFIKRKTTTNTKNEEETQHLYNNMSMKRSYTNAPNSIMDSSFAFLDTEFLMNSELMDSPLAAPKNRIRALPTLTEETSVTGPSTGGFCLTPKRGLGRRSQSQRHHLGFSACMVVTTPDMAMQETFQARVPLNQKRTSAPEKQADRLGKLEADLRAKEKECLELRELVDSCSQALPQRTMAGRKAASMTNIGVKSFSGKQQRQISFGLDSELTRESAEEKDDDFNDASHRFQRRASADTSGTARADMAEQSICAASKRSTSRVLPRRSMAGRMAASVRRLFPFRSKKGLVCNALVDNTAESVESDCSAW